MAAAELSCEETWIEDEGANQVVTAPTIPPLLPVAGDGTGTREGPEVCVEGIFDPLDTDTIGVSCGGGGRVAAEGTVTGTTGLFIT